MENLNIIPLNRENIQPFEGYLLPQVFWRIEAGEAPVLLGAYAEGHSLGAMAACEKDGRMEILSLYVDRAVRRRGVGTALLEAMAEAFRRLDMPVTGAKAAYMVLEEEDADEIAAFLRRRGFKKPLRGNRLFAVDSRILRQRPLLKKCFSADYRMNPHVTLFHALTPAQMRTIESSDAPFYLKPSGQPAGILKPASVAWVEDDAIMGWLLLRQGFDGEIILTAAYVREDAPAGCFVRLLEAAGSRVYLMLGRDFLCYISTVNEYVSRLVEKVAGEKKEYENFVAVTGGKTPDWLS